MEKEINNFTSSLCPLHSSKRRGVSDIIPAVAAASLMAGRAGKHRGASPSVSLSTWAKARAG